MKHKTTISILLLSFFFVCFNVQTAGKTVKHKSSHATKYYFTGYMTDDKGDHPIELTFNASYKGVSVYKNVTLGGKIRMKCTKFGIFTYPNNVGGYSDFLDYFTLVGKDGPKDFIMNITRVGNCAYEGTAWVGSKRLSVSLWL